MEHLFDLVDLLSTIRDDEAMAEYVFAIAPRWDGTVEDPVAGRSGHDGVQPLRARAPRARDRLNDRLNNHLNFGCA